MTANDSMAVVPKDSQNITREKMCFYCNNSYELSMFNKGKSICKKCQAVKNKEYRIANKDKIALKKKEYSDANKKRISDRMKKYYRDNLDEKKLKASEYRASHKQEIARSNKAWREKHKCYIKAKQARYYAENTDSIYANKKQYHALNYHSKIKPQKQRYSATVAGKAVEANSRNKRRDRVGGAKVSSADIAALQANSISCFWCGRNCYGIKMHIDHVFPLARGGIHELSNLVMACPSCNMAKKAKDPFVFAKEIGKTLIITNTTKECK